MNNNKCHLGMKNGNVLNERKRNKNVINSALCANKPTVKFEY